VSGNSHNAVEYIEKGTLQSDDVRGLHHSTSNRNSH